METDALGSVRRYRSVGIDPLAASVRWHPSVEAGSVKSSGVEGVRLALKRTEENYSQKIAAKSLDSSEWRCRRKNEQVNSDVRATAGTVSPQPKPYMN